MRLYLSSQNFGNYTDELLQLVGGKKKVAYIGNAKDYDEAQRKEKVPKHRKQFEDLGFSFVEFDLRNYFGERKITLEDLDDFGLVWGSGGNTFLLRTALKESGMDEAIVKLLQQDRIVYGGSSAGSIIVTPGLEGCENWDDIRFVETVYGKKPVWQGLNLVPFYFVPHYNSEWVKEEAKGLADFYESKGLEYKTFEDGQVWIIDGERKEFLS